MNLLASKDGDVLKLTVTYGIPERKQVPVVGKFVVEALGNFGGLSGPAQEMINKNRIPLCHAYGINGALSITIAFLEGNLVCTV